MISRGLLPASARNSQFCIPSDIASLERNCVLAENNLDLIGTRRRADNRLGLAVHIALLRHPGQGLMEGDDVPEALIAWLGEQVSALSFCLADYGSRTATCSTHSL